MTPARWAEEAGATHAAHEHTAVVTQDQQRQKLLLSQIKLGVHSYLVSLQVMSVCSLSAVWPVLNFVRL